MDGWIKLHRKMVLKPIWVDSTPEQKTILITLLMMANHQEKEWEWRGEKYKAKSGQFVTSLDSIVKNCGKGISIQNVRTALVRFEKYEFLTSESTNKNRLISIVNWGFYQGDEDEPNKLPNRQLTSNQQATNKQLTTNKNVRKKECKNVRIKTYTENPILIEALNDFEKMRKEIKAPLTDRAYTLLFSQLDKLGANDQEKIDILNQSIMHSWKGVFALKKKTVKENSMPIAFQSMQDWLNEGGEHEQTRNSATIIDIDS